MILPFCCIFVPVIVNSQSNFRVKISSESSKFVRIHNCHIKYPFITINTPSIFSVGI